MSNEITIRSNSEKDFALLKWELINCTSRTIGISQRWGYFGKTKKQFRFKRSFCQRRL